MTDPLAPFPISLTADTDEAQAILSREMSSLRFRRVRDRSRFELRMNGVHLGRTMVGYNRFSVETEVEADMIEDALIFTRSIGSPTQVRVDRDTVDPDRGAITSPGRQLSIHRSAESGVLILKTTIAAVEQQLRESIDRPMKEPLLFETSVDLSRGVGVAIQRQLKQAIDQICGTDSVLRYPLMLRALDETLLSALLSLPHNYRGAIADDRVRPVARTLVRRAESYLEANAVSPIGISDVVRECGCSRRALFSAFQRDRGYTPMQFLAMCRLDLARNALRTASVSDTVASIAHACGFLHAGRFSQLYRQRFGETPSETIRKSDLRY